MTFYHPGRILEDDGAEDIFQQNHHAPVHGGLSVYVAGHDCHRLDVTTSRNGPFRLSEPVKFGQVFPWHSVLR